MANAELHLSFDSAEALGREYDANLGRGRAFVPGASGVERLAICTLTLTRGDTNQTIALTAQVVLVSDSEPMRGVGLQLIEGWKEPLAAFVEGRNPGEVTDSAVSTGDEPTHTMVEASGDSQPNSDVEGQLNGDQAGDQENLESSDDESLSRGEEESLSDGEDASDEASDQDSLEDGEERPSSDGEPRKGPIDRRTQIRRMSLADRSRVAHGSSLEDRVLLERIFGSAVWEILLRSGTLTPPEVANIARKGSLPVPLLELIVDNTGWIRQDVVRRALLMNPRTPAHCVIKILQAAPKSEVKLITETAGAYPSRVRSVLLTLKGKRS